MTETDDLIKVLFGGGLFAVIVIAAIAMFMILLFQIFPRIIEAIK